MLTTKATLFEYMKAHPNETLEWCIGVRKNWWWMRPSCLKVHARAAHALQAMNLLKAVNLTWKSRGYKLSKTD